MPKNKKVPFKKYHNNAFFGYRNSGIFNPLLRKIQFLVEIHKKEEKIEDILVILKKI